MTDTDDLDAPTPTDYLAVLKMHVDLANSEKQAIWTRHATMLVGNSLIVSVVGSDRLQSNTELLFWLNICGFVLCIVWAVMNWNGWGWFYDALRAAKAVPVPPKLNPFADYEEVPDPRKDSLRVRLKYRMKDSVFVCAMLVVIVFALIYALNLLFPKVT